MAQNFLSQENELYVEAHHRMVKESDALLNLLSDMAKTQHTREKRITTQFTKYKNARIQFRKLHERLNGATTTGGKA